MEIFKEGTEFEINPIYIIPKGDIENNIENNIEKECRICLDSIEEGDNKLLSICKCKGSLGYVHRDCVLRWIKERNGNRTCELCKTKYDKEKLKPMETLKIVLFCKESFGIIIAILILLLIIIIIVMNN